MAPSRLPESGGLSSERGADLQRRRGGEVLRFLRVVEQRGREPRLLWHHSTQPTHSMHTSQHSHAAAVVGQSKKKMGRAAAHQSNTSCTGWRTAGVMLPASSGWMGSSSSRQAWHTRCGSACWNLGGSSTRSAGGRME